MYHIIKENGKDILLCSGTMGEGDFIKVKKVFGIDKDQIRFVSHELLHFIHRLEAPTKEEVEVMIKKLKEL